MKKIIIILILAPIIYFGQNKRSDTTIKISINIFKPIQILGNENLQIDHHDNFSIDKSEPEIKQNYFFGIGADFGFFLKNKNCLIFNLGYGLEKSFTSLNENIPNPVNHPNEVVKSGLTYRQNRNNYNFSIFYQSQLRINRFEINGGIGFSYLLQGKRKEEYVNYQAENIYINQPTDSLNQTTNVTYSNTHSFGIGLRIGFNICILKNFKLGADFSNYLYYTHYSPKNTMVSNVFTRQTVDDGTGNLTSKITTNTTNINESKSKIKQLAFTNIIPTLKFCYEF